MTRTRALVLGSALGIYAVSTLISMAVMSVGAGFALIGLLVAFRGPAGLWRGVRHELSSPAGKLYGFAALALAATCVLSLVIGKLAPLSYGGRFSEVHVLKDSGKLWYLFWPLLIAAGLRALERPARAKILKAWFITFGILSAIGIIQFWTGWPRRQVIPEVPTHYHATLFLGFHLAVASILIFPFFAALDAMRRSWREGEGFLGIPLAGWLATCSAGLLTLFFTYSRTLWAALPIGLATWGFLSLPRKQKWALAAALLALGAAASRIPAVQSRLTLSAGQFSVMTREDLWRANIAMFRARPLTGVGWLHNNELSGYYLMEALHSNDVFSGHAHDNVLDVLGGTGAIGLLAWLFWCAVPFYLAWRARHSNETVFGTGIFCAWIVFQLNGLTQVNFWDAKVTHQMMWVMAWLLLEAKCGQATYPES